MSACAATRIEAAEYTTAAHDWSAPFYASGDRGKSIVADGRGGCLARGWYHRPEASAPAQGPHPTKTAAREAAVEALKERVRAEPQPSAEILGDPTGAAAAQKEVAPHGYVRTDIEHTPEAYGLTVSEDGAGLYAPPGSTVVVEPVAPAGAGLAVLYRFGRAEIWDLTHNFVPGSLEVGEGSTVIPMIDAVEPQSGRRGRIDARSIDKAHRVAGVYVPVEIAEAHAQPPTKLPVMTECPKGMGEHYVPDASAYPAIRPGETAIFDPSIRDLRNGGFYVIEWNGGSRSASLARHRPADRNNPDFWFVDPVNRPGSSALHERRLKRSLAGGMMCASDGPYEAEQLQAKIVGAVVGILVPGADVTQPAETGMSGQTSSCATTCYEQSDSVAPVRPGLAERPEEQHGAADARTVLSSIRQHEDAWRDYSRILMAADALRGDHGSEIATDEEIEAADRAAEAASDRADQTWRSLFAVRPNCLHGLWLLLTHIEQHHQEHHGMTDAPDIWGMLAGTVEALRTAQQAPSAPHDLSKLSVSELAGLYEIAIQQSEILLAIESQPRCETLHGSTPLGHLVEAEGSRFSFLSDDVIREMERRNPKSDDDRSMILSARLQHELRCNLRIGPEFFAEIASTWGAK